MKADQEASFWKGAIIFCFILIFVTFMIGVSHSTRIKNLEDSADLLRIDLNRARRFLADFDVECIENKTVNEYKLIVPDEMRESNWNEYYNFCMFDICNFYSTYEWINAEGTCFETCFVGEPFIHSWNNTFCSKEMLVRSVGVESE